MSLIGSSAAGLGLLLVVTSWSPAWQAFGLGLWVPGGGFWLTADPLAAMAGVVLGTAGFVAWVVTGNVVALPSMWIGLAGVAAWRASHTGSWAASRWAVPAAVGLILAASVATQQAAGRAARRRGAARNARLAGRCLPVANSARPAPCELSPAELGLERLLLDIALQPLDRFDGLDTIDQFREAAWRYQLSFCSYALSLANYCRTPAFGGYLAAAQANLIRKMTDKRVWRYWRLENLWGNLRSDPDPIPRDNIMFTGYLGLMLTDYQTVTGDDQYSQPGSLTFEWDDRRRYRYDQRSILDAVDANFAASPFTLFPCEPNWIFPSCNTFGISALLSRDRLHSTTRARPLLARFEKALDDEFLTPDGRITAIRSARLGFTIPSITSTMADASAALLLHPSLPAVAIRTWLLTRDELIHLDDDGGVRLDLRGWDKLDVGNYKLGSDRFSRAMCAAAAHEMGDLEAFAALRRSVESAGEPIWNDGTLRYAGLSTLGNATFGLALFGRPGGWRDLVATGLPAEWIRGPRLSHAGYPDVLVALATTDGLALDLVLRPGRAPGRYRLGLSQLRPQGEYEVTGACQPSFVADEAGHASIEVDLAGRAEVRIRPRP